MFEHESLQVVALPTGFESYLYKETQSSNVFKREMLTTQGCVYECSFFSINNFSFKIVFDEKHL
jgi:hypothetical protein